MSQMIHRGPVMTDGGLTIPQDLLRELGLVAGDEVKMGVVDGELRIRPARIDWERIHAHVRKHVPEGVSLADELIADRRAEAARE